MDSIDRLLAEVKAEYDASTNQQPNTQPLQVEQFKSSSKPASNIDSLLAEVKADYEQQNQAEEQLRQQQLKAEELRQLEELTSRAKVWLEKLNPLSTEGIWFENFAKKYPSKLAAAIDYLRFS